ncbi:hypothetical protein CAEBREN_02216 [Caenorhabditis brenneri]|uniref:Uncharacterized protein n=1 Tax=Caenorhabditis brenneri TaxID=135651 RepID=G0NSA7_CAEBE|nr:hypothetical protein CAEBREN_02216 [Caenorhabditis brenneri]
MHVGPLMLIFVLMTYQTGTNHCRLVSMSVTI